MCAGKAGARACGQRCARACACAVRAGSVKRAKVVACGWGHKSGQAKGKAKGVRAKGEVNGAVYGQANVCARCVRVRGKGSAGYVQKAGGWGGVGAKGGGKAKGQKRGGKR